MAIVKRLEVVTALVVCAGTGAYWWWTGSPAAREAAASSQEHSRREYNWNRVTRASPVEAKQPVKADPDRRAARHAPPPTVAADAGTPVENFELVSEGGGVLGKLRQRWLDEPFDEARTAVSEQRLAELVEHHDIPVRDYTVDCGDSLCRSELAFATVDEMRYLARIQQPLDGTVVLSRAEPTSAADGVRLVVYWSTAGEPLVKPLTVGSDAPGEGDVAENVAEE